jgi:hypothetical protein
VVTTLIRQEAEALEASNSLADLAARIKQEHEAVSLALKDSVRHAIAAENSYWKPRSKCRMAVGCHGYAITAR